MHQRYYTALGEAHDDLLRCKDCQRLVNAATLRQQGGCACGCRRVTEVSTLSVWEWLRIRLGLLSCVHRDQFLAEFSTRPKAVAPAASPAVPARDAFWPEPSRMTEEDWAQHE